MKMEAALEEAKGYGGGGIAGAIVQSDFLHMMEWYAWLYDQTVRGTQKKKCFLDVGSGTGVGVHSAAALGRYAYALGMDFELQAICGQKALERIKDGNLPGDTESIIWQDNLFYCICFNMVTDVFLFNGYDLLCMWTIWLSVISSSVEVLRFVLTHTDVLKACGCLFNTDECSGDSSGAFNSTSKGVKPYCKLSASMAISGKAYSALGFILFGNPKLRQRVIARMSSQKFREENPKFAALYDRWLAPKNNSGHEQQADCWKVSERVEEACSYVNSEDPSLNGSYGYKLNNIAMYEGKTRAMRTTRPAPHRLQDDVNPVVKTHSPRSTKRKAAPKCEIEGLKAELQAVEKAKKELELELSATKKALSATKKALKKSEGELKSLKRKILN